MTGVPPPAPLPFTRAAYELGGARLVPAEPLAEILAEVMVSFDPWKRNGTSRQRMIERFRRPDPGGHRFAIQIEKETVGAAIFRYPFLRGPYLEMLGLLPKARGRGIGAAVLELMETETRGEAQNLWLCVSEWNDPARGFYRRCGFVDAAALPDVAVQGTTEIFMRKILAPPPAPVTAPVNTP